MTRMTLYYISHSLVNQIKKLFHTWIAVFILIMFGFGVVGGIITATVASEPETGYYDDSGNYIDDGEIADDSDAPMTDEDKVKVRVILELAIGGLTLLLFGFNALTGDKNGGSIFLPADVNILFAAPLKPQSVLAFRLVMQLGTILLGSIYIFFQIPNLAYNMELGVPVALAIIVAWLIIIAYSRLISVFFYTEASTHLALKKYVAPVVYGSAAAIAGAFLVTNGIGTTDWLAAADSFFNAPVSRFIPVWGWIKGLVMYTAEGNYVGTAWTLAALVVGIIVFGVGIWHVKADFYEDAMAKSEQTAALQQAAKQGRRGAIRKKERKDTLIRDRFNYGCGANVFFFRTLYNRFRFAWGGIMTKSAALRLFLCVAAAVVLRFFIGFNEFFIVALIDGMIVFYAAMGNPISEDTENNLFITVPESAWAKIYWSEAGCALDCLLDAIPGFIAAALILGANPIEVFLWMLFTVSVNAYSSSIGAFIHLSVPTSAGETVKSIIQMMLIFFGIAPALIFVIIGLVMQALIPWMIIGLIGNFMLAILFCSLSPLFLVNGRK